MESFTSEEEAVFERLARAKRERDEIPAERRRPVARPEKYARPVGMDEQGRLFPDPQVELE